MAWWLSWVGRLVGWESVWFGFGIAHSVAYSALGNSWQSNSRGRVGCVHNFVLWFFSYETETELHMYICVMASMLQHQQRAI